MNQDAENPKSLYPLWHCTLRLGLLMVHLGYLQFVLMWVVGDKEQVLVWGCGFLQTSVSRLQNIFIVVYLKSYLLLDSDQQGWSGLV